MSGCIIPEGYTPRLNVYETQRAIEFIKRSFQKNLGSALNLKRVSAPLFVRTDTGLNDDRTSGLLRCSRRGRCGVSGRAVSGEVEALGAARV